MPTIDISDLKMQDKDSDASYGHQRLSRTSNTFDFEKNPAAPSVLEIDKKRRQEFSGLPLFWVSCSAIGAIYGDIGTSPLYVFSSTFSSEPTYEELICATSLIVWSLFLMVAVKYVFIVLFADDEGEGGTFALYSHIARYASIERHDPTRNGVKMERFRTGDIGKSNRTLRRILESSTLLKNILRGAAIFGISAVMSDGALTPAQSVLGAIQGLTVIKPDLTSSQIVGITIAILFVLFAAQPLGLSRLSFGFSPIIIIWLLLNLVSGIYNLATYDASLLKAFNPYYAGKWFMLDGSGSWRACGGILLAFTGVEALFADLGAFSRRAIQFSWLCFVFPCLVFTYIGQAAHISHNAGAYSNPFYNTLPPNVFYFGLVMAILATIVASQAMITGTFQILVQAMNLNYFPRLPTKYLSNTVHGQAYIPLANWLLMAGTMIVAGVFNNTTSLGNAYGLCVMIVTFITTCMVSCVAVLVWRIHPIIVFPIWLIFALFDGIYLSVSLLKVPLGAWFTIMLAVIISTLMLIWRWGTGRKWDAESHTTAELRAQLITVGDGMLWEGKSGAAIKTLPGVGMYFDETDGVDPQVFIHWIKVFSARHEVCVFVNLKQAAVPTVAHEDKNHIRRIPNTPNAFRIVVRYGYSEVLGMGDLPNNIMNAVQAFIVESITSLPSTEHPHYTKFNTEKVLLERCVALKPPTFMFGKKNLKVKPKTNIVVAGFLQVYLTLRILLVSKPKLFELPADQSVEVGRTELL